MRAPSKEKTNLMPYLILAFLLLLGVASMFSNNKAGNETPSEYQMQELSEKMIKDRLKDPDSAEFRNFNLGANGHPCGEVNSKNGFGGYTGFKRYMIASEDIISIEGEAGISDSDFNSLWQQFCNN